MADEKHRTEDEHWQKLREEGLASKKNQSTVAYNITSLAYHNSSRGDMAKYEDDMSKLYIFFVTTYFHVSAQTLPHSCQNETYQHQPGTQQHPRCMMSTLQMWQVHLPDAFWLEYQLVGLFDIFLMQLYLLYTIFPSEFVVVLPGTHKQMV